jgi:hypothetical protein
VTAEHAAAAGGEVEALARVIYEAASDAADVPWDSLSRAGLDALYVEQARAVLASDLLAATRQAAADAVLAEAHRLASAHHVANNEHGRIVALGERLAAAARGAK